jgi:hypothetical protein
MLKNTTRVKIPKMYWEKVSTLDLNEESGLYEAKAEKGYFFPTINSTFGIAKGHKGIWEIIRYVAEAVEEVIEIPEVEALIELEEKLEETITVAEQVELEVEVEESLTAGKTIKELWVIGKHLGFKGCTRWSKTKLIEEIEKVEKGA